jgi:hypothetical protein
MLFSRVTNMLLAEFISGSTYPTATSTAATVADGSARATPTLHTSAQKDCCIAFPPRSLQQSAALRPQLLSNSRRGFILFPFPWLGLFPCQKAHFCCLETCFLLLSDSASVRYRLHTSHHLRLASFFLFACWLPWHRQRPMRLLLREGTGRRG